ncbi:MAG: hypothetical protein V8S42_00650 [Lachnospiraceae bacterium]
MNCLITIICVLVLFFVIVMIIDCNRFVKREYCCESGKLKREGTFVLLSDLHNKSFGKQNERLFRAMRAGKTGCHPDCRGYVYFFSQGG